MNAKSIMKLVRSNDQGPDKKVEPCSEGCRKQLLAMKIVEEAVELAAAIMAGDPDGIMEEVGDVQDILETTQRVALTGEQVAELWRRRDEKLEVRGGFEPLRFIERPVSENRRRLTLFGKLVVEYTPLKNIKNGC